MPPRKKIGTSEPLRGGAFIQVLPNKTVDMDEVFNQMDAKKTMLEDYEASICKNLDERKIDHDSLMKWFKLLPAHIQVGNLYVVREGGLLTPSKNVVATALIKNYANVVKGTYDPNTWLEDFKQFTKTMWDKKVKGWSGQMNGSKTQKNLGQAPIPLIQASTPAPIPIRTTTPTASLPIRDTTLAPLPAILSDTRPTKITKENLDEWINTIDPCEGSKSRLQAQNKALLEEIEKYKAEIARLKEAKEVVVDKPSEKDLGRKWIKEENGHIVVAENVDIDELKSQLSKIQPGSLVYRIETMTVELFESSNPLEIKGLFSRMLSKTFANVTEIDNVSVVVESPLFKSKTLSLPTLLIQLQRAQNQEEANEWMRDCLLYIKYILRGNEKPLDGGKNKKNARKPKPTTQTSKKTPKSRTRKITT